MTPPNDSALIAEAERLAGCVPGYTSGADQRREAMRYYHRLKSENWQPEDEAEKVMREALGKCSDHAELWCNHAKPLCFIAATAVIRAALDKAKSDEREACFNIALANGAFSTTAAIRNRGDKS